MLAQQSEAVTNTGIEELLKTKIQDTSRHYFKSEVRNLKQRVRMAKKINKLMWELSIQNNTAIIC